MLQKTLHPEMYGVCGFNVKQPFLDWPYYMITLEFYDTRYNTPIYLYQCYLFTSGLGPEAVVEFFSSPLLWKASQNINIENIFQIKQCCKIFTRLPITTVSKCAYCQYILTTKLIEDQSWHRNCQDLLSLSIEWEAELCK